MRMGTFAGWTLPLHTPSAYSREGSGLPHFLTKSPKRQCGRGAVVRGISEGYAKGELRSLGAQGAVVSERDTELALYCGPGRVSWVQKETVGWQLPSGGREVLR
jgi:hypothetical protein